MFRFSIEKDASIDARAGALASAGITEDEDFGQRLQNTDEHRADERYFRVENETPETVDEAVEYVQGILFHRPKRVWLGGEPYNVEVMELRHARKPGA